MSYSNYGVMSASNNSKDIVLKFLKKILLNNANIMKQQDDLDFVKGRLNNSIHLLEELEMFLNRSVYNEVVERVSQLYEWNRNIFEQAMRDIEEKEETGDLIPSLPSSTTVITNIYEGFKDSKEG